MQLVAYGAQDIYLTGNPQITFFKVVYRRHTNFSMEAIEQTMNGSYSVGGRQTVTVSRNGDLINRMWIQQEITASSSLQFNVVDPGYNQFDSVELEIGGQLIDKHYGHWLAAWAQLTEVNPTGETVAIGQPIATETWTLFQKMALAGGVTGTSGVHSTASSHFIPLQFWFCRNPGLALPLIALQYHEVKLYLNWNSVALSGTTPVTSVWCDYIYLDTDERRRFAQVSHEYLIEQVQYESHATGNVNKDLNFNHPVKELVWTGGHNGAFLCTALDDTYQLKLNGHDRFAARNFKYFTNAQVWQHHTGYGGVTAIDSIGVYSFALKPEEHQPSGTCNFSRIDNAQLVQGTDAAIHVYAVNYNVLRIMSGMGGLAYSN